jgi:hypothetical protein
LVEAKQIAHLVISEVFVDIVLSRVEVERRWEEREEGAFARPSKDKGGTSGKKVPRMSSNSDDDEQK